MILLLTKMPLLLKMLPTMQLRLLSKVPLLLLWRMAVPLWLPTMPLLWSQMQLLLLWRMARCCSCWES